MEPERWTDPLDEGGLWRATRDPKAKQPKSHKWSYFHTVLRRKAPARSTAEPVVNKPSPRRERRTGRRRADVGPPVGVAALNADKTECPYGHSLADAYEHFTPRGWRQRRCRTCALERQAAKRALQPPKPERVGPRGAAALALTSTTCRRGHVWSPHNTIVRGGESKLAGTRLCRSCRNWRSDKVRLEAWRARMNAEADAERERKEADHRVFEQRRLDRLRHRTDAVMRERRFMLHRDSPSDRP